MCELLCDENLYNYIGKMGNINNKCVFFCSMPILKIAKYEKTYQSSLAARLLLFTADSENDNGKRIIHNKVIHSQTRKP